MISNLQSDSDAIVQDARSDIHGLISRLESQIEANYEEATLQGKQQGFDEAKKLALDVEGNLQMLKTKLVSEIHPHAFKLAKEILNQEIELFPDTVLRVVRLALSHAANATQINIRANPEDVDILCNHKESLTDTLMNSPKIEIRPDKNVERGGVLVQSELGTIDAQIEIQLGELSQIRLTENLSCGL